MGAPELLPDYLAERLNKLTARTPVREKIHVNVAVGYGGRREIVDAVRELLHDAVAKGIVGALAELGSSANKPLVVRLDGNNVEEGRRILTEANHPLVTLAATMDEGADKAAELAHSAN